MQKNVRKKQNNSLIYDNCFNKKGITLIALVISIIVIIILAGVSLNATIGENGIITKAQDATYMQSIAALEEWLQSEYIKYYDETSQYTNKVELLANKIGNLFLKDGNKNYITYNGKMYYLINKNYLPNDLQNILKDGNTNEYMKYIRLIDVYGVTSDLKVYYCKEGVENILGAINELEVDPNTLLAKVNSNSGIKAALTDILTSMGEIIGEDGITIGNVARIKNLELDGSKYEINDLSALAELNAMQRLTLTNLNINNLEGIEKCPQLYYIYLKNCEIIDYSNLKNVIGLEILYIYISPDKSTEIANKQVEILSKGLVDAIELSKFEVLGISGTTDFFENDYVYKTEMNDSSDLDKRNYIGKYNSNITNIDSFNNMNINIKNTLKRISLNNNKLSSISALKEFTAIEELDLMSNPFLTNLEGIENCTKLKNLAINNCNLTDISNLNNATLLEQIVIYDNNNLENLYGLENSNNLKFLRADNCNIKDISSLYGKTNLKYLDLENNKNLRSVLTLGSLSALSNLYLAGNEQMIGTEVRDALANEETHILQNCGSNYTIPNIYMIYFSNLESYDYSNMNLTDESNEINALKNKTNVKRLNLSGNSNLSNNKLQEILKTMTGLEYLSLKGLQLENLEFMNTVTNLKELDIRDCKNISNDLSILNEKGTELYTFVSNNTNLDLTKIQLAINNISKKSEINLEESWILGQPYQCRGVILIGGSYNFYNCTEITDFRCNNEFDIQDDNSLYMDFTGCNSLETINIWRDGRLYKLPANLKKLSTHRDNINVDLTNCSNLTEIAFDQLRRRKN